MTLLQIQLASILPPRTPTTMPAPTTLPAGTAPAARHLEHRAADGLLPCPFCAGPASVMQFPPDPPECPVPWIGVGCHNAACHIAPVAFGEIESDCRVIWNTRPPAGPSPASDLTPVADCDCGLCAKLRDDS